MDESDATIAEKEAASGWKLNSLRGMLANIGYSLLTR